jgi:hypothetical protein
MVNMYAVKRDILGAQGYITHYDGLTSLGTGSGVDRGAVYNLNDEVHYRASGLKLISVTAAGVKTELGTLTGTEQVAMPYSFNTQCVIANGKMYLYDSVGGFVEVVDADLGSPIDCIWVDGYYFLTDGEYIYHTDIGDETAIDPLKFATAEFMPDQTLGLSKTQDNKVVVWGRTSVEYFVNDASTDFAFARIQQRAQKIGIVATHAKCEYQNLFFITGGRENEGIGVHIVSIGESQKISTREIEKLLNAYAETDLSDMRMEVRSDLATTFILVHLPSETLCYNHTIAQQFGLQYAWSILKSDIDGDTVYRAINGIFDGRSGYWCYGDKVNTNIGRINYSLPTQYTTVVEGLFFTPLMRLEGFSIDEIELETIPGHSSVDDATVAFSATFDGLTYSSEHWTMYGEPYNYGTRFLLRAIGYVEDWVGFKFRTASASKMAFALLRLSYG